MKKDRIVLVPPPETFDGEMLEAIDTVKVGDKVYTVDKEGKVVEGTVIKTNATVTLSYGKKKRKHTGCILSTAKLPHKDMTIKEFLQCQKQHNVVDCQLDKCPEWRCVYFK